MSNADKNSPFRQVAGWNEYVRKHYIIAEDALWWWKYNNKPNNGCYLTQHEKLWHRTSSRSFWTQVKKLNSCKSILTNVIDGISGESNVVKLLGQTCVLNISSCPQ